MRKGAVRRDSSGGNSVCFVNKTLTKKELTKTVEYSDAKAGKRATVVFLDNIKKLGFEYATKSGVSICMADMHIPSKKAEMIREAEHEVIDVQKQYGDGLITRASGTIR